MPHRSDAAPLPPLPPQFEITEENGPEVLQQQCLGYVSVQMYDEDRKTLKFQSPAPFPLPSLTLLYSDLVLSEE